MTTLLSKVKKTYLRKIFFVFFFLFFLIGFYAILYKIYLPRVNDFGCFDDCFNYIAGYFINRGKILYSEIFFNHQPFMAIISSYIQSIFHPINIYELILVHRKFLLAVSLFFNLLIIFRFRFAGILFMVFYEPIKYYFFGERFLAEGIIVYPLVYMTGLIFYKLQGKKIYLPEYFLCAIFTWFIIFMREPFIPPAVLIYILILTGKSNIKIKILSFSVFFCLILFTLLRLPFSAYVFNIFTLNKIFFKNDFNNLLLQNAIDSFLYPIIILFKGESNLFKSYLMGLDIVFLFSVLYLIFVSKKLKLIIVILLVLGFINLRPTLPGKIFYEAFHMIPWYGVFIFLIFFLITEIIHYNKKVGFFLIFISIVVFISTVFSPSFYIRDKIDPHFTLITNYGLELQVGETINALSDKNQTLFLDGADDLIYWQANLISPYKYSWYTSFMPYIPEYTKARLEMFKNNPPDFYFGSCPKKIMPENRVLPADIRPKYTQLYSLGNPTCLYVLTEKLKTISQEKWKKANDFLYSLP